MDEQLQKEEFSLMDLLKVLWSKIKLLILVFICGGIIGGSIGIITTYKINYWGTSMEFYVNPERPESEDGSSVGVGGSTYGVYGAYGRHVMDNIVKLLNSENFAEKLILNGNKLPEKNVWVNVQNEQEVALELNKKIDLAEIEIIEAQAVQALLDAAFLKKNEISMSLNEAKTELNDFWYKNPYLSGDVISSVFNEREYFKDLDNLNSKYPNLANLYQKVESLTTSLEGENEIVKAYQADYSVLKKDADEAVNVALVAWRKTEKYRANLQSILNAVEFSYLEEDADVEDAVNLARSFIYVNISVLGDANKEFSEDLMEKIQKNLPIYVSEKMIVPDGYSGTSCTEITTTSRIGLTNPGHTTKSAIKYGILVAAAALVIAAVIIIIIDRSDKRVRDYDQVARLLNVPLLGVIPSIKDESITEWNQNMKEDKGE